MLHEDRLPDKVEQTPSGVVPELAPAEAVVVPAPERIPFWGYDDLLLVMGLLIAAIVVVGLIAGAFVAFHPKMQTDPTPLLLPTQLAVYALIYFIFRLVFGVKYHKPVFRSLGWRRSSLNLAVAAAGGVALAFALSGIASVLHTPKVDNPFEKLLSSRTMLLSFGLIAVTLAPLFEELLFRGFIQPLLSRTFGVIAGIVLTAALFGSLHAPEYSWAWQYALFISLAGVVFGWLRARTDCIVPSTVMHGCFNAVSFAALLFSKNI